MICPMKYRLSIYEVMNTDINGMFLYIFEWTYDI